MIQLNAISKGYLGRTLFENLTWTITDSDRIGLVGGNGSGKTTLLKILCRQINPDRGHVHVTRGSTVGYLPQSGVNPTEKSLFLEALSVFEDLLEMEREQQQLIDRLEHLDPHGSEATDALNRYGHLQTAYQLGGGFTLKAKVGQVLTGLGFSKDDWGQPVSSFSGGWQMRIALAKLLLQEPNLLLLDEPTNHLDLEARNWLESYLADYPHAYIIVSHDRFFLDTTVNRVADLFARKLTLYTGGYTRYLEQRESQMEALKESYRRQREHIERLETFINKFRYKATKAKQVQSRIKELKKLERIQLPEARKTIRFSFPQPPSSGRRVLEILQLSKSYSRHLVFEDLDLLVERGQKLALVGPNGAGKSTLIRILAGREPFSRGGRKEGHNVQLGYFAQDQDTILDNEKTVLDTLMSVSPLEVVPQLRTLLGSFLFRGDDVFKKVGVLSGGERNRLALAKLLLEPSNFLLMDEPTNHLDMQAKEILLRALQEFSGTVVFVSHDRYLIDQLATHVIEVGGGTIRTYAGNYEDYLWKKQQENPKSAKGIRIADALRSDHPTRGRQDPTQGGQSETTGRKDRMRTNRPARINPQKLEAMSERISGLEDSIADLEATIAALERQLADGEFFKNHALAQSCLAAWEEAQGKLHERMAEWERLTSEREAAAGSDRPSGPVYQ